MNCFLAFLNVLRQFELSVRWRPEITVYKGEKWHCANPGCQAEIVVTGTSKLIEADKPQCGCGSVMRRAYEKPAARKLTLAPEFMKAAGK
jgi:hypothetical protein